MLRKGSNAAPEERQKETETTTRRCPLCALLPDSMEKRPRPIFPTSLETSALRALFVLFVELAPPYVPCSRRWKGRNEERRPETDLASAILEHRMASRGVSSPTTKSEKSERPSFPLSNR